MVLVAPEMELHVLALDCYDESPLPPITHLSERDDESFKVSSSLSENNLSLQ